MSDSHRLKRCLFDIVEKHKEDAVLFIFLGDGENDFDDVLTLYPNLKNERVCGNNDWYSAYLYSKLITAEGKKIFITHGHTFNVKFGYENVINQAKESGADICLFGHTHTQYTDYIDGMYIMNPGAVCSYKYGMIDITKAGIVLIPASL